MERDTPIIPIVNESADFRVFRDAVLDEPDHWNNGVLRFATIRPDDGTSRIALTAPRGHRYHGVFSHDGTALAGLVAVT